jgi:Transposase IS116/IS110/IS902 family
VAPGNDESAGKQRSGKTRQGNRTLRTGLTQIAHAAARTKGTYLSALYQRLATRRGKKRAIMAVAHAIVVSAFHMLSRHEPYRELGANYFDAHRRAHRVDHVTRRIQRFGYHIHLEPVPASSRFIFNGVSKVPKNHNVLTRFAALDMCYGQACIEERIAAEVVLRAYMSHRGKDMRGITGSQYRPVCGGPRDAA